MKEVNEMINELMIELRSDVKSVGKHYKKTYGKKAVKYYLRDIILFPMLGALTLYGLIVLFIGIAKTF